MARKIIVIFQNSEILSNSNFHIFRGYQILTYFITVAYWTLLALKFQLLNLFLSGLD